MLPVLQVSEKLFRSPQPDFEDFLAFVQPPEEDGGNRRFLPGKITVDEVKQGEKTYAGTKRDRRNKDNPPSCRDPRLLVQILEKFRHRLF